jgi:hypothetical protein
MLCGTPFAGNPQTWTVYPSTLLLPLMPTAQWISIVNVINVVVAGAGTYLWLRRGVLSFSTAPSLYGALIYALGGCFVSKSQFPNMMQCMALTPWVLWRWESALIRPCLNNVTWLGFAIGLQLLGAHAQVTVNTFYLCAADTIWMASTGLVGGIRQVLRSLSRVCASLALAVCIAFVKILPVIELIRAGARSHLTLLAANRFHVHLDELTNFLLPWRHGSPWLGTWFVPHGNFWETACYVGAVPACFAILGVVCCSEEKRRSVLSWLGIGIFFTWCSLGVPGGLYDLVYTVVPGVKSFHDPARFLIGAAIAIPVLAASFVHRLGKIGLARPVYGILVMAVVLISAADMATFDRVIYPTRTLGQMLSLGKDCPVLSDLKSAHAISSGEGRYFMPDPFVTWPLFTNSSVYEAHDKTYLRRWINTMTPNFGVLFGINQVGGYEPEDRADIASMLLKAQPPPNGAPSRVAVSTWYMGFLSTAALSTYRQQRLVGIPGLELTYEGPREYVQYRSYLYSDDFQLPRARTYRAWRGVVSQAQAFAIFDGARSDSDAKEAFSRVPVEGAKSSAKSAPLDVEPATVVSNYPDHVVVSAPAKPYERLLLLADTAHPGWTAKIGQRSVPIYRAGGVFRGVFLPASSHSIIVDFKYAPASYLVGLYVTAAALGAIFFVISTCFVRGRP